MRKLYYQVWVRSERYRGNEALTYYSEMDIPLGAVVRIPLRDEHTSGFVASKVKRPGFKTRPIEEVLTLPPLPKASIRLAAWLKVYYAASIGSVTLQFLPSNLRIYTAANSLTDEVVTPVELPALTADQSRILGALDQPDTYILHGRTGSGKTRIYLELAKRLFAEGKSSIILTPEIGLTPQLEQRFLHHFQHSVVLLHSQLTTKERIIRWQRVLQATKPLIIIGPRSALFSPVRNLGLIVVDESHENAYKQEQTPYYHTTRVAGQLRALYDAYLILGSATPSITDYYMAEQKHKSILRMDQLAISSSQPATTAIVDLKDRAQFSTSPHLSDALIGAIRGSLNRGEQALLFLNRRGTARITLCQTCGWQALCPDCDLPLAYHGDEHQLRCHACGFRQRPVLSCPICQGQALQLRSFGTKAIAASASKLFPEARIARFDTDNKKAEGLAVNFDRIAAGEFDILIGTQILAKGLDLPRLSTLGIVLADTSLYLPDYTARERTYQLISQVSGRVGRGHRVSTTIVQTYTPESRLLKDAMAGNWNDFYASEIAERRAYHFPPFTHLLKVSCRRASAAASERALRTCKQEILAHQWPIEVEDPVPSFHEKVGGKYQWQLIIKTRQRSYLLEATRVLPKDWTYDLDPVDLL